MAVPKKRTGASAQAKRRANWKATLPELTKCKNCGATALTHTVCTACGYYRGKAVSIKSADYVATPIETVKPVKKSASKKPTKKTKTEETGETITAIEKTKTEETAITQTEESAKETKPKKATKKTKTEKEEKTEE